MAKGKTRTQRIREAVNELNKALMVCEPDMRLYLRWPMDKDAGGKEFMRALDAFIKAYKKYYELTKVDVELVL